MIVNQNDIKVTFLTASKVTYEFVLFPFKIMIFFALCQVYKK
jgi:hypothetical protein